MSSGTRMSHDESAHGYYRLRRNYKLFECFGLTFHHPGGYWIKLVKKAAYWTFGMVNKVHGKIFSHLMVFERCQKCRQLIYICSVWNSQIKRDRPLTNFLFSSCIKKMSKRRRISLSLLNLDIFLRNLTLGELAYIWQSCLLG